MSHQVFTLLNKGMGVCFCGPEQKRAFASPLLLSLYLGGSFFVSGSCRKQANQDCVNQP